MNKIKRLTYSVLILLLMFGPFAYGAIRDLSAPPDWEYYKNNVLGIEFYYPPKWGSPKTEQTEYLTDLSRLPTYESYNFAKDNIKIVFKNNDSVKIIIFNENYQSIHSDIHSSLNVGDVASLRETGDIRKYSLNYDDGKYGIFKEIDLAYNNGIKEVITQQKQDFTKPPFSSGILYSYKLNKFAYTTLQNGYFDYALISLNIGNVSQIKDSMMTLDKYLNLAKISKSEYEQASNDFEIFVNSIYSFKPIVPKTIAFQYIAGEDPNITAIRKYYYALTNGDNINYAKPYNYEKLGKNLYRFHVDYQDHNQEPRLFRVTMEVKNGKLKASSSEEIIGTIAKYDNMSAFAVVYQGKSRMILNLNNKEVVINEDKALTGDSLVGKTFSAKGFSPKGNFLVYFERGYEWGATRIYDIHKRKEALELSMYSSLANNFTLDEKYFYAGNIDLYGGPRYGTIYLLPDFIELYDVFKDKRINADDYLNIKAECDCKNNLIVFTLYDNQKDPGKKEIVEYSLTNKKAHIR